MFAEFSQFLQRNIKPISSICHEAKLQNVTWRTPTACETIYPALVEVNGCCQTSTKTNLPSKFYSMKFIYARKACSLSSTVEIFSSLFLTGFLLLKTKFCRLFGCISTILQWCVTFWIKMHDFAAGWRVQCIAATVRVSRNSCKVNALPAHLQTLKLISQVFYQLRPMQTVQLYSAVL